MMNAIGRVIIIISSNIFKRIRYSERSFHQIWSRTILFCYGKVLTTAFTKHKTVRNNWLNNSKYSPKEDKKRRRYQERFRQRLYGVAIEAYYWWQVSLVHKFEQLIKILLDLVLVDKHSLQALIWVNLTWEVPIFQKKIFNCSNTFY